MLDRARFANELLTPSPVAIITTPMIINTKFLVAATLLIVLAGAIGAAGILSALGLAWYTAPIAVAAYALGRFKAL